MFLLLTFSMQLFAGHIRQLFVQIQQWKHQSNVWNLFKVNNKETTEKCHWRHIDVFIVNFEHFYREFFCDFKQVKPAWLGPDSFHIALECLKNIFKLSERPIISGVKHFISSFSINRNFLWKTWDEYGREFVQVKCLIYKNIFDKYVGWVKKGVSGLDNK